MGVRKLHPHRYLYNQLEAMVACALFYPFAFSYLSACAIASPLSHLSSSSLLKALNSTSTHYSFLNVPPQANATVPASNM